VVVLLEGDVVQDDDLGDYYRKAMNNWALPVGEPYNQGQWDSSKTAVLRGVTQYKYPLAQIRFSQAYIDPDEQTAQLSVTVVGNHLSRTLTGLAQGQAQTNPPNQNTQIIGIQ